MSHFTYYKLEKMRIQTQVGSRLTDWVGSSGGGGGGGGGVYAGRSVAIGPASEAQHLLHLKHDQVVG